MTKEHSQVLDLSSLQNEEANFPIVVDPLEIHLAFDSSLNNNSRLTFANF